MIKKIGLLLLWPLLLMLLFPLGPAYAEENADFKTDSFTFPSSLIEIEDEAFDGTAAQTVIFRNKLKHIGDKAFYNNRRLVDVYIPASVESLGTHVFQVSKSLRIHAAIGSRAHAWANEHHVTFVQANQPYRISVRRRLTISLPNLISHYGRTILSPRVLKLNARAEDEGRSMRPQERPELNPIDYRFP